MTSFTHDSHRLAETYDRVSDLQFEEGKRARLRGFLGQPVREFFRRYFSLQGWRDGGHGLWLSILMSYYAFVRQKMLWQMGRTSPQGGK